MPSFKSDRPITFFKNRDRLPSIEDSLWLIVTGVVKTYTIAEDETATILGFWGDRDLVGKSLSNIEPYLLECLTDVEAISIHRQKWQEMSDLIIRHGQQTQLFVYIMRSSRVHKRLWMLLEWLANRFGKNTPKGKAINFKITHQELADAIGTTRITVTKILSRFELEGLIYRPRNKFIINTNANTNS